MASQVPQPVDLRLLPFVEACPVSDGEAVKENRANAKPANPLPLGMTQRLPPDFIGFVDSRRACRYNNDAQRFCEKYLPKLPEKIFDLQEELNFRKPTDVVVGTLRVPRSIEDEEAMKRETEGLAQAVANSAQATPSRHTPLAASAREYYALFPPKHTRHPITFPMPADDAYDMMWSLEDSSLGIEGWGTVVNPEMRRSKESILLPSEEAANGTDCMVELPLQLLKFDFPEERARIRTAFCGAAGLPSPDALAADGSMGDSGFDLVYKPYKFVYYTEGDFFLPHSDSMSDARQIGSLAVQVPIVKETDVDSTDKQKKKKRASQSGSYDTNASNNSGQLVFYLGRQLPLEDGRGEGRRWFRNSATDHYRYETPKTAEEELKLTVDLTSHLPQPSGNTHTFDVKYAAWLGDIVHEVTRVKSQDRAVLLYRIFRVPKARVSATDGDDGRASVYTEEERKLLGPLATVYARPMPATILTPADRLLATAGLEPEDDRLVACRGLLKEVMVGIAKAEDTAARQLGQQQQQQNISSANSLKAPRFLGVVLRHGYPPAGLKPSALKGADAALYHIASRDYTVTLCSAYELRNDYSAVPYRATYREPIFDHRSRNSKRKPKRSDIFQTLAPKLPSPSATARADASDGEESEEEEEEVPIKGNPSSLSRTLFLTRERLIDAEEDLDRESAIDTMCDKYPVFTGGLWMQIGFGAMITGGHTYGNVDCGCDWWYRSAVMIIDPRPSRRHRCVPLLLAGLRGPETFKRLMATPDVFTHIMSFM